MQKLISARTVGLLAALLTAQALPAQGFDPRVASEVNLIRAELFRSNLALRQYTWTEHTEVLVKGKVQSASDLASRYDANGQMVKTPADLSKEQTDANGVSKRPLVRKKSEMQDYIERATGLIGYYVPPDPQQLDAMLSRGDAVIEKSASGQPQIRFKGYYQRGDSMVFTYDAASKALLRASVTSTLGSPKDPVTLDAVFEMLPDGVNHLASTTLTAKSKKVEVRTKNVSYAKVK